MHNRERGAVNTMFFLITLMLLIVAVFIAWTQHSNARDAELLAGGSRAEAAKLRLGVLVRDHLLEDIRKVVGEAGTYKRREGYDYTDEIEDAKKAGALDADIPELANVTVPSQVTTKVAEFARDLKIPASLTNGMANLLGEIQTAYKARSTELADAKSTIAKLTAERTELEKSVAQINNERATEARNAAQAVAELRQHIDSNLAEKQRLIDQISIENQKRRTELSELTEKHKEDARGWAKELSLRDAKNAALASAIKFHNAPDAEDGAVLSCSATTNLGYIDLGSKDMLPVGAVFTISDPRDGKHKAMAKVKSVDKDRAEVQIYDVKDRFDYPVAGDKVSSPIYSPGVRRQVALIGRFGYPYDKDMVKTIFESLGNRVHDKVGPGVDLVILGDETLNAEGTDFVKVEESDDYKLASRLGAEFAPVNKIRGFLKQ